MDTSKTPAPLDFIHQKEMDALRQKLDLVCDLVYSDGFVKAWFREIATGKGHREAFNDLNERWAAVMGGKLRYSDYKSFEYVKKRYLAKPNNL